MHVRSPVKRSTSIGVPASSSKRHGNRKGSARMPGTPFSPLHELALENPARSFSIRKRIDRMRRAHLRACSAIRTGRNTVEKRLHKMAIRSHSSEEQSRRSSFAANVNAFPAQDAVDKTGPVRKSRFFRLDSLVTRDGKCRQSRIGALGYAHPAF